MGGTSSTSGAMLLAERAATAPAAPGVYFLVGDDDELLYIGKAGDLRQRLRQHARTATTEVAARGRYGALYGRTARVLWEPTGTEPEAAAREADLIVALRPSCNASIVDGGRWAFVTTGPDHGGGGGGGGEHGVRFSLSTTPPAPGGDVRGYGCFPHLGGGLGSPIGTACAEGYLALLRLLWASAGDGRPYPAAATGAAPPPTFSCAVPVQLRLPLHALLSGTSERLLAALATAVDVQEPYRRPALRRDLLRASDFFRWGPARVRRLRLRHRRPVGPLTKDDHEALLRAEVEAVIGDFWVAESADRPDDPRGRRDRRWRPVGEPG